MIRMDWMEVSLIVRFFGEGWTVDGRREENFRPPSTFHPLPFQKKCRKLGQEKPVCGSAEVNVRCVRFFISGRKGKKGRKNFSRIFSRTVVPQRFSMKPLCFLANPAFPHFSASGALVTGLQICFPGRPSQNKAIFCGLSACSGFFHPIKIPGHALK